MLMPMTSIKFRIMYISHNDYFGDKTTIFQRLSINRVVQDRRDKRDFSRVFLNFTSFILDLSLLELPYILIPTEL